MVAELTVWRGVAPSSAWASTSLRSPSTMCSTSWAGTHWPSSGVERDLGELLLGITARCGLPRFVEKARQYEARCGARYRAPAGGLLPVGVPARVVRAR